MLLLLGTASVSSESDASSELSVSDFAACQCCIDSPRACPSASRSISPSVRSIS